MRLIIDTDNERIIVPKKFFTELDKINAILKDGESNKQWTAEEYIKNKFDKAINNTILRSEDVKSSK